MDEKPWESGDFQPIFAQIQRLLANERWNVITATDAISQEKIRSEIVQKIAYLFSLERAAGEKSGAEKIMKKIQGRIRDEKHLRGLTFDRALEIIEEAARSISGEEV